MSRPLTTLGIGLLLVLLVGLAVLPGWAATDNLVLVLLTVLAGGVVLAVVARRAALRHRAAALAELERDHDDAELEHDTDRRDAP